jgi:hypothetical protein
MFAPAGNPQNVKDKNADQLGKEKHATPYRIHVSPLLDSRCCKQPVLKMYIYARWFVQSYGAHYVVKVLIWWS